jgi:tetratricopeptide (TPR) repeat protein
MVGISLRPGEARFDTRMKVYNRTPTKHSFLWWENAAVPVNQQYRLVFPPDVRYVQFHYRKSVTTYPIASGVFNGIRLGDSTDISWHRNTRQPTSYFCASSKFDFFGGYDEGKRCGVIHVADRNVSVGKKMFTWAYHQLSKSWERALTDADGEYAELMASSYSLDQPDFAWLMPYESREFSQLWYPVGNIGTPLCACREAAIAVEQGTLKLQATLPLMDACLFINGEEHVFSTSPDQIFTIPLIEELCSLRLTNANGHMLLSYEKSSDNTSWQMPEPLPDNPTLDKLKSAQELYLLGVHAAQYRDPATRPAGYWHEALRRDPEHLPTLIALAGDELSHFRPESAWKLAQRAWKVATVRNFHPESGELQYIRGRILEALDRPQEALDEYLQAAWVQDARSRAMTRAALLELRMNMNDKALEHAEEALRQHMHNETAMLARIIALRRMASPQATQALAEAKAFDGLNLTLRALIYGASPALYATLQSDPCQSALDIAQELYEMGENALAADILSGLSEKCAQVEYVRWFLCDDEAALDTAAYLSPGIAYPLREIEYRALKAALSVRPQDANAMDLLACLQYHTGNHEKADSLWSSATMVAPGNYKPYRNLAVARYSHTGNREEALPLLDKALSLCPEEGQLQWEKAYLMTRLHINPVDTVAFIKKCSSDREDMAIELCRALNLLKRYLEAIDVLVNKHFTPCEGGEHAVAEQYMFAHHALGREFLQAGRIEEALHHFQAAQQLPDNLGAGLWNEVLLIPHQYFEALCQRKLHHEDKARALFSHILILKMDYFTNMHLPELPCWQAMALQQTGRDPQAREVIAAHLRRQEQALNARDAGYFKTTPFFISYMEPAAQQRQAACNWQIAMAHWASGDCAAAASFARRSLEAEPANLYATLLTQKL